VTWGPAADGSFDTAGVVAVRGVARIVGGGTVDATARVQVTEPVQTNIAADDGVLVAATFTESGYSAERLRNGNLSEKAWSNWKPGTAKNPSDTITFTLPRARDLTRIVTHFYRDGSSASFPETLKVQVRAAATGEWTDAGGPVAVGAEGTPVVDVPVAAKAASAVRVVMAARPGGYITAGEIEVFAKAPGVASDAGAASVEVSGTPIASFDPETADYRVVTRAPSRSRVTATARDPYAKVAVVYRDEPGGRSAIVTVTGEDGSQTRTYRIRLVRR
ncbi:discoidin domain-containing protein, partial [Streptomyces sp. NPDC002491]